MAYTMEQYQKDYFVRKLPEFLDDDKMQDGIFQTISNYLTTDDILARLVARGRLSIDTILSFFPAKDIVSHLSPGERLEGLSSDERLEGLSSDERLEGLSSDERLKGLSPDKRLEGLSPDEIQAYLQKLKQTSDDSSTELAE